MTHRPIQHHGGTTGGLCIPGIAEDEGPDFSKGYSDNDLLANLITVVKHKK